MGLEWDPRKDRANRRKHGLSFEQASKLFTSGVDFLELFDAEHSDDEVRFLAIGPIDVGMIVVIYTVRDEDRIRIISARPATRGETACFGSQSENEMSEEIRELTSEDFARTISHRQRMRIMRGDIDPAKDVAALRRFAALTQEEFAEALGISVHTLRNWEQGRRRPEGPAIALLRIAARRPSVFAREFGAAGVMGSRAGAQAGPQEEFEIADDSGYPGREASP